MPESLAFPREIIEQFQGGRSLLLVSGGPGSGKTILTISLLLRLKELGMKPTLVSARLPAESLLRTTPAASLLGETGLVDTTARGQSGSRPDIVTMPLSDLSDLAMIYLRTTNHDTVVALDSWDALLQREKRPDQEVYTALVDLVNRTPGSLIFTMENPGAQNPLRHIADAELRLETDNYEGNMVRLMTIEKLRGRQIETPTCIFTLNNGVFHAHNPTLWALKQHPVHAKKPPEPVPECDGHFSTGMTKLDRLLGGGYKRGSYVGIEVDLEVPPEFCDLTYLPTASDFLTKGRPVMAVPPGARDAESLWDTARAIFDDGTWAEVQEHLVGENVKVFSFGSRGSDSASTSVGRNIEEDLRLWREAKNELRERCGKSLLTVVGYDTIHRIYGGSRVDAILGSGLPEVRHYGDLHISVVTNDLATKDSILAISDYYFRLKTLKGLPVFWGVKPRTGLFTISLESDNGTPKTNIVAVS